MQFFLEARIFPNFDGPGVKKLVKLKIFVLMMRTMKFVEWLGIDSGMLKLIEKKYE